MLTGIIPYPNTDHTRYRKIYTCNIEFFFAAWVIRSLSLIYSYRIQT